MAEDNRADAIIGRYERDKNEGSRLSSEKSRRVEFLTTTHIMERYLEPQSMILDIGAGTGCYSFHYAKLGHRVVARDLVPLHVEQMRADPLCSQFQVDTGVGDAQNLSEFPDGTFDAVLCLGPIYHIGDEDGRRKCITECLRVVKVGGILAVAYISKFFVYVHLVRQRRDYLADERLDEIMDKQIAMSHDPDEVWFFDSPQEIEQFLSQFKVDKLAHAGTDGISILAADMVNSFSDEEYDQWLKYHFRTCEEPSIIGYSNHALFVCRKN